MAETGRAVIAELKVTSHAGGPSDPPTTALFEALRYSAIVEANIKRLSRDAQIRFGRNITPERPIALIVGEESWWRAWFDSVPGFAKVFADRVFQISEAVGLPIRFASLAGIEICYGLDGVPPRFLDVPKMAAPDPIGPGAGSTSDGTPRASSDAHEANLQSKWWAYAAGLPDGVLEAQGRQGRPPVVEKGWEPRNLLLPSDPDLAKRIISTLPARYRHRHFRSFRSSQALAQSVFGALAESGWLDLLASLRADCGRPALMEDLSGSRMRLEVNVTTLNEPTPTQIDVLFEKGAYRVAVECKLCEETFGSCSRAEEDRGRPALCDGGYHVQQGRTARCALTEVGVSYWTYAPRIFDWEADHDRDPCPLRLGYQLARNIMAAVVGEMGVVDLKSGHALVVYDARHPAYGPGGAADQQWRSIAAACKWPGSIRRVSWQEIARLLTGVDEMAWLVDGLSEKHGIVPTGCNL